jgi:hypothetical protein
MDLKYVYSCIYKIPSGHPNVYIQKYMYLQANAAPRYKNGLTSLYTTQKRHTSCTTHVSSIAPPPAPPSGSGGPPPPAPGSGGPPPTGPSCPGGRRPLVIAASTAARRTTDRHGGGTPTLLQETLVMDARPHALRHIL